MADAFLDAGAVGQHGSDHFVKHQLAKLRGLLHGGPVRRAESGLQRVEQVGVLVAQSVGGRRAPRHAARNDLLELLVSSLVVDLTEISHAPL
eukprot:240307-Pyramimonas_sp.AAC.1